MTEKMIEINDVRYMVKSPTSEQLEEAKVVYNKAFKTAIQSGGYLRAGMEKVLEEQGLWNSDKRDQVVKLQFKIAKLERKIKSKIKQSEATKIAIELREARLGLRELIYERSAYDDKTAEGQAEEARLVFLTTACFYDYTTNKLIYSSVDEYRRKSASGDALASRAISEVSALLYNYDPDFDSKLPEEKFFKRFGEPEVEQEELADEWKEIQEIEVVDEDIDKIEYLDES